MRALIVVFLLLTGAATAQERGVEGVIRAQVEAFQADDFAAAFEFASPNIQGIFRTPENFGAMVQRGYPMVWRPSELRFLEQREIAGALWQKLMVRDAAGLVHILDYQMILLDGVWRINAVQLLAAPEASA